MNLSSRTLEKRLRTLHRSEIQKSPDLRREFKRLRKAEVSGRTRLARRLVMPIFWSAIFLSFASKLADVRLAAAVVGLWAAGTAFRWGQHWFQQFYASEDLVVLNLLPLNDRQIFRFQLRRYFTSAVWIAWDMLLAYLVLALLDRSRFPAVYIYPAAGLLQAALVIALAVHAASRLHMLPLGTIGGLFRITAVLLLFLAVQGVEWIGFIAQGSEWFLPTGWLNYTLFSGRSDPAALALLVPIAALIYLARFSFQRLRSFYSLEGFEIVPSSPGGATLDEEEELTGASFDRRLGPTEIEDRITARYFLQGVNWDSPGPVERFVARMLPPRDRVIMEFLVAQDPGWTRSLKWTFWVWLAACAVVLLLGHLGGTVVFFTAYVLASASLPLFGGYWRGMRQAASGGVFLPGYSLYPIAFNSLARILLKVNLIRICAASPFLVSFAALAANKLNHPPLIGAVVAVKLLGVLLAVQPLFVLFPISSTTNDTSRMRLVWLLVFIPVFLLMLGSLVAVFLSETGLGVAFSYAILLLLSTTLFFLYRRAYRRGKFDLLCQRAQGQL